MKRASTVGKLATLLTLFFVAPSALAEEAGDLQPYTGMKDQFEISLPAGWSVFDQGAAMGGKSAKTGLPIIFSSVSIDSKAMLSGDQQALRKVEEQMVGIELGGIPGFMLDRLPAQKGMSCSGFDSKAQKKVLDIVGKDPMFGKGRTIREKPHAETQTIGACQALRVRGKGTTAKGSGKNLDVFALSDGKVLFLFELFNLDEHYVKNVGTFEKIISTVKLAAAR